MDAFLQFLSSNTVLALVVAIIIFVVTLVLVVKRLIGFFITLLLLFFTIASGYAILNHDIVRAFFMKYYLTNDNKETNTNYQQKLIDSYDHLKKELEGQKQKLQESMSHTPEQTPEQKDEHK